MCMCSGLHCHLIIFHLHLDLTRISDILTYAFLLLNKSDVQVGYDIFMLCFNGAFISAPISWKKTKFFYFDRGSVIRFLRMLVYTFITCLLTSLLVLHHYSSLLQHLDLFL